MPLASITSTKYMRFHFGSMKEREPYPVRTGPGVEDHVRGLVILCLIQMTVPQEHRLHAGACCDIRPHGEVVPLFGGVGRETTATGGVPGTAAGMRMTFASALPVAL